MDSGICSCRFENEGKFFSLVTPDGRLKVWDCVNGKIKHDLTPGSHLGASKLTCLSWRSSARFRADHKKRRKRKSGEATPSEQNFHIGLGSAAGSIFIFDVLSGEIKTSLEGGHNDRVNGLDWDNKSDLLYSCSDDKYIAEWSVKSQEIKCKWKGDKTSVRYIQVSPEGKSLLSAGRDIRLWDLDKKEILKKFTGHATSISHLLFTPLKNVPSSEKKTGPHHATDGYYFLSGAQEDRFLSAWKVDLESKDKSSIVSFSLSDEPTSMELAHHPGKDKPLHLIVVSKDGQLHLFRQSLNGHLKKPVKPNTTLQLATPGTKDTTPEPVPIICARFVDGTDPSMLIAYGSPAKPQFEVLKYEELEKNVCLVRDYKCGLLLREENNNQRAPDTNKAQIRQNVLTTLSTENMALAQPSCGDSGSGTKSKKGASAESSVSQELSMEDRLKTMNLIASAPEQPNSSRKATPQAGSMTQMVIQALNSQDKRLLEGVLVSGVKPTVIQNTIKRLPVNYLIPFVTELTHRIQATPSRGVDLVPWIKSIMTCHMSYLMSVPNLVESLGGLYQIFESQVMAYSRLCKLQGRLDLMLSQVSAQTQEIVEEEQLAEPLTVYKEESDEMSEGDTDHNSEDSTESMKEDASDEGTSDQEEKEHSSEVEDEDKDQNEKENASDTASSSEGSEDEEME